MRIGLDLFVALSHFVGSQSRSAAWAVWQNLVAFVDEARFEEFL